MIAFPCYSSSFDYVPYSNSDSYQLIHGTVFVYDDDDREEEDVMY